MAEHWQLGEPQDKAALTTTVESTFRSIYEEVFAGELGVNHSLPILVRGYRHTTAWHSFVLLTPWMLAQIYLPREHPGLALPAGWSQEEQQGQSFTVIGPLMHFEFEGEEQQAHLNYHPALGHFLIRPLVQALEGYATPDAVFAAWDEVLETRRQVKAEFEAEQAKSKKPLSRRDFFARLRGGSDSEQ